jgi:MbtH protein
MLGCTHKIGAEHERGQSSVPGNDEEQYSIWPEGRTVPDGWRAMTEPASREESLDQVPELWPDIRAMSVRGRSA